MHDRLHGTLWFLAATVAALAAHVIGVVMAQVTTGLMGGISEFAIAVRAHDIEHLRYIRAITFPGTTLAIVAYFWPVLAYSRAGYRGRPSPVVQRRVLSAPLIVGLLGFAPWVVTNVYQICHTLYRFGRWSPELASQHVFSPLVAGFLASTTSYLVVEQIMRAQFVPRVFPEGGLTGVAGALTLGVRARLAVLMTAVAFTPLFTMLGLFVAAESRVRMGLGVEAALMGAVAASRQMFIFYVVLGVALTLLLARSLTRPLGLMAATLKRVQAGNLRGRVEVNSTDEVGILADGVNAMVETLREREHILQTFGRVVEPSIRDRLLSGTLRPGGERRLASVLFADLRGYTGLAERSAPESVVSTLNHFFTGLTGRVRACGGFVDKFIGDSMLAVFGLFDPQAGDARASALAAVRAALGMREEIGILNEGRRLAGEAALGISIGIHTGEVLAGTIGARERHEYTVIGDTVNVAARLQQLCKDHERDVLVSAETYELARSLGFDGAGIPHGAVTLRGRSGRIRVVALG
jgi:adenylate cyclase